MQPFFLMLYGFPATGKYTIAKEICARSGAILIDNHLINNAIFQLFPSEHDKEFPDIVWQYVGRMRGLVFDAIKNLARPQDSFIFTNVLFEDSMGDRATLDFLRQLSAYKNAILIPVRLECDLAELERRINMPGRKEKMKMTSLPLLQQMFEKHKLLNYEHPNHLTLDVTQLTAEAAADAILAHVAQCQKQPA